MSAGADLSGRFVPRARGRFAEVESYLTGPPQRPLEVLNPAPNGNPPAPATLEEMQAWARGVMASRPPDFTIGEDYLRRWYVIPRNLGANLYLHDIRKSDDDRALHDHPWGNTSYLLFGGYREHTPEGVFERVAGDTVTRAAGALHRLEVAPGRSAISLFATGPKVREWGFACPNGWVPWEQFLDVHDSSKTGRGCGE